jgi:hypothetical protein
MMKRILPQSSVFSFKSFILLVISLCFISVFTGCEQVSEEGEVAATTELPPNTREESSLSEASEESGLSGIEICQMLTANIGNFLFSDRAPQAVCGLSALAGAVGAPDSAEICTIINDECQANFTAQTTCNTETVNKITACPVTVGQWRDCIDAQVNFLTAVSNISLTCMDLQSYAQEIEAAAARYPLTSCQEIERTCPGFESATSSNDSSSANYNNDFNSDFNEEDNFNNDFNEEDSFNNDFNEEDDFNNDFNEEDDFNEDDGFNEDDEF